MLLLVAEWAPLHVRCFIVVAWLSELQSCRSPECVGAKMLHFTAIDYDAW
jgi:hypothetical protein